MVDGGVFAAAFALVGVLDVVLAAGWEAVVSLAADLAGALVVVVVFLGGVAMVVVVVFILLEAVKGCFMRVCMLLTQCSLSFKKKLDQ